MNTDNLLIILSVFFGLLILCNTIMSHMGPKEYLTNLSSQSIDISIPNKKIQDTKPTISFNPKIEIKLDEKLLDNYCASNWHKNHKTEEIQKQPKPFDSLDIKGSNYSQFDAFVDPRKMDIKIIPDKKTIESIVKKEREGQNPKFTGTVDGLAKSTGKTNASTLYDDITVDIPIPNRIG
jgi:hypothetical protein